MALAVGREFSFAQTAPAEFVAPAPIPVSESPAEVVNFAEADRLTPVAINAAPNAADPHAGPKFMGVSSCASAACHGGPASANVTPTWKNAYTVVYQTKNDPHRNAYRVLTDDRSKRILWLLDGAVKSPSAQPDKPWSESKPQQDARCLTCHSSMTDAETPPPDFALSDGVSCEACHGPSEKWKGPHTLVSWKADAKRYRTLSVDPSKTVGDAHKMWNTKDLSSRAAICMRCHVGGPDRDVNHDLIAAGHPRLNFEFSTFQAMMPKHWDDSKDRQAMARATGSEKIPDRPLDIEARLWSIGQGAEAVVALRLLRQRIDLLDSQGENPHLREDLTSKMMLGRATATWPEFTEYDCFACHHDLSESSWRRLDVQGVPAGHPRRPGTLPWGNWHFSRIQNDFLWKDEQGKETKVGLALEDVRKKMQKLYVAPKDARSAVETALTALEGELAALELETYQDADVRSGLYGLGVSVSPAIESWDEAVQRYLAYVALTNTLARLDPRWQPNFFAEQGPPPPVKAKLFELQRKLGFKVGVNSPNLPTSADWDELKKLFRDLEAELIRNGGAVAKK
ncbi:MAG: multiheme c-type cytochrome [Pirellulales bacterium]